MQQDFYQQNKSTFAPLMEACDGVPLPIALVDTQLTQFWENQYLKTNFPFLCSKDNVLSLLQGYDIDALIASLHTQNGALSFPSRLPMAHTVLSFSPLFDQNQVFVGATVHFSVNTTQMFPSDTNRAQEMLQNFNTTLRDPLSSIFSNISTISLSTLSSAGWRSTTSIRARRWSKSSVPTVTTCSNPATVFPNIPPMPMVWPA